MRAILRKQKRLRGIRKKLGDFKKVSKEDLNFYKRHTKPPTTKEGE